MVIDMTTIGCRLVCAWVAATKDAHPCSVSVHGLVNGAAVAARVSGIAPAVLRVGWLR